MFTNFFYAMLFYVSLERRLIIDGKVGGGRRSYVFSMVAANGALMESET